MLNSSGVPIIAHLSRAPKRRCAPPAIRSTAAVPQGPARGSAAALSSQLDGAMSAQPPHTNKVVSACCVLFVYLCLSYALIDVCMRRRCQQSHPQSREGARLMAQCGRRRPVRTSVVVPRSTRLLSWSKPALTTRIFSCRKPRSGWQHTASLRACRGNIPHC